ncbi:hypothetical protein BJ322DRAFT_1158658 [Thelephora terrestris]|uniref:Uncharacterized protein n=1 Tax=Thelephora terrestris TaxID=56493 RepID=A0A9P6L5G1_9AGAM|nr:hypothetical protein BJ322DRAFT_1158658 [Thelephora terrestris]
MICDGSHGRKPLLPSTDAESSCIMYHASWPSVTPSECGVGRQSGVGAPAFGVFFDHLDETPLLHRYRANLVGANHASVATQAPNAQSIWREQSATFSRARPSGVVRLSASESTTFNKMSLRSQAVPSACEVDMNADVRDMPDTNWLQHRRVFIEPDTYFVHLSVKPQPEHPSSKEHRHALQSLLVRLRSSVSISPKTFESEGELNTVISSPLGYDCETSSGPMLTIGEEFLAHGRRFDKFPGGGGSGRGFEISVVVIESHGYRSLGAKLR